jgi:predicted nucleic acid-binding protein
VIATLPVPSDIYLDTGLIVAALSPGTPDAQAARQFLAHLIAARSHVYVSQIMRIEFAQAVRKLAVKTDRLPPSVRARHSLDQWISNSLVREQWMTHNASLLRSLLTRFNELIEIPITLSICENSLHVMAQENLDSQDAIHVATARFLGLTHLATTDGDLRRLKDFRVWLIRDPRP